MAGYEALVELEEGFGMASNGWVTTASETGKPRHWEQVHKRLHQPSGSRPFRSGTGTRPDPENDESAPVGIKPAGHPADL